MLYQKYGQVPLTMGRIISAFQIVKGNYPLNRDVGAGVTAAKMKSGQEEHYEIQHTGPDGRQVSRSKG